MVDNAPDKGHDKKPIEVLRERRGGLPKTLLERNRQQAKTRKQIIRTLREGPKTIPEIAATTGIPVHRVVWQVMAMKKYGKIAEGEERDSYFAYALTTEQESKK